MKTLVSAVLLIVSMALLTFTQTRNRTSTRAGNVEQTLAGIEKELVDALVKGDVSAHERYLADSFIFTAPDGAVMDKARSIADVKSGDVKIQSSTLDDMKVQPYGDSAVVTYGSVDKGSYKGKDLSGRYRWTDVFVNRDGRWQIVAQHGCRVAEP